MRFSPQRRAILRHPTFEKCSEDYSFLTFSLPNGFLPQRRAFFRQENSKKCFGPAVFCTFSLPNVCFATAACNFATSDLRKVLRGLQFFNIFTSKCAFCHNGVHFFDRRTAKSASDLRCFVHFHFQMCVSPQRRVIFDFSPDHLTPHPPL